MYDLYGVKKVSVGFDDEADMDIYEEVRTLLAHFTTKHKAEKYVKNSTLNTKYGTPYFSNKSLLLDYKKAVIVKQPETDPVI
jgi:hypothetical protein